MDLESYWQDLKPRLRNLPFVHWANALVEESPQWDDLKFQGRAILTLVDEPSDRRCVYNTCRDIPNTTVIEIPSSEWLERGLIRSFCRAISELVSSEWGLLWSLLKSENFELDLPLYSLVDRGKTRVTELYRALWEARFSWRENQEHAPALVSAMIRWLQADVLQAGDHTLLDNAKISSDLETVADRLDMLLFLVTLGRDNGLLGGTIIIFDGLEDTRLGPQADLLHLPELSTAVNRWAHLGSGCGIIYGATRAGLDRLKVDRKAYALLAANLV